jgi:guanosine-3',5'-bis(diphosphate) 3'-pyrophosphohydrolase
MGNKNIFDEEDIKQIQSEYESLVNNLHRSNKPGDKELIDRAFKVANEAHWDMRRKSGEPYIIHPIKVAKIVNQEIGLGAKSIAVSLLHDVVEDTEYTLEDVERDFGEKIASLIGLQKYQEPIIRRTHPHYRLRTSGRCFLHYLTTCV